MTAARDAPGESSKLIVAGALLGLLAALGLSALRALGTEPEQAFGNTAFAAILVSPYIAALVTRRSPVRVRGPILLAASLLSLASVGISLAGAGVAFLPAAVLLGLAAAKSLRLGGWQGRRAVVMALVALGGAAITGSAFASLFAHEDARCWEFTTYEDGRTEWRSVVVLPPEEVRREMEEQGVVLPPDARIGPSAGMLGPLPQGVVGHGSMCTSDVITNGEAARSLGMLMAGMAGLGAVWAAGSGRRRPLVGLVVLSISVSAGLGSTIHYAYLLGPAVLLAGGLLAMAIPPGKRDT